MNAIEISIKMETDAIAFYNEASEKMKNRIGKMMFLSVAEDEKRHLEMLKEILKGLDVSIKDVSPMRNIKTIFEEFKNEMMERVKASDDELNAFKVAIYMEMEGIKFYKRIASVTANKKEKILFERLVTEEEQHYAVFNNTYNFMRASGDWFMWEEHSILDGGTPWA